MTPTAAPAAPTVQVRDTRDLLSVVPYALGYRPAECLLVVCVRPGGDLGLVARTDLADLRRPADRAEVAELVATRAAQDGTVSAWVVVYTADDVGPGTPARAAADAFSAALDAVVPEHEAWVVGPQRYRSLDCTDPVCCPTDGFGLDGLESTEPGAQLVLSGRAPMPSRDALYRIPRADQAQRNLASRAARRWDRARTDACDAGEERGWRSRSFDAWTEATAVVAAGGNPSPALLGRLAAALEDRWVRDAVLLWFVPGRAALAATVAAGETTDQETDAAVGEAIATVVDPDAARRPDEERTRVCVALLESVVAHAARRRTAAPLTLLAFLAWWSGEGARASYRCAEALRVDDAYRLGLLLAAALDAAVPPGWVRARSIHGLGEGSGPDLR
ncbi:hypothetical protein Xcel_1993 [Xylanimonas cellulosilytica DSM 15894]|uniref:DUF4192 domain-containing protein n=1 Tax=Xylanimonas cellulosilytica (strain DSM 15894 / JCM 12276 / CECT 5975 / KCTC 9989 / LMG 20990 / NBRC 107835 / XIL07) TaxID=446471 RepID=D1BTN3_XYLCX|nr:DUF4192 family protein [Xylanimonas cellulosilytica]ACZ31012.1 hypothetical protein Xcel_1993 [Xylanimonas cellulosilytica DSM 15894]